MKTRQSLALIALTAFIALFACNAQAQAQAQDGLAQREAALAARLRCVVVDFFEQRYGSFVRYTPPWRPSTWLLWCGPFLAVFAGLALLRRTLKQRVAGPAPLTAAERARASDWLQQSDEESRP